MVDEELTDGRRIAQLLSSELTGLSRGALADVSVIDADPDVTPADSGAFAYAIEHAGDRVGTVSVTPEAAVLSVDRPLRSDELAGREGVAIPDGDATRVVVERGAVVKAAVDALRATLESD